LSGKLIFLIELLVLSGCATTNKLIVKEPETDRSQVNESSWVLNNISDKDFIIDKAELIIVSGEGKLKANAVIKYRKDSAWLVSIKSLTGIEIARALLTGDSVKINDRLKNKYYYGGNDKLTGKFYGLSFWNLPLLLGDIKYIDDTEIKNTACVEGELKFKKIFTGQNIEYIIGCKQYNWIETNISGNEITSFIKIRNLVKKGNEGRDKRKIFFDIPSEGINGRINLIRIKEAVNVNISFIPGKGYERKELK
jgi:hypothetical protein